MSKKNRKSTRVKQHVFDLKREKEAQEERAKKLKKKEGKLKVKVKKGVKFGKNAKAKNTLSKSEKTAVAKAMDIDS